MWIPEFENTKRLIRKETYCKDEEISEHFAKWLNTDCDEQYFDKIDTHPDKMGIQITHFRALAIPMGYGLFRKRGIYESASVCLCDTMIYSNVIDRASVSLCEDNACARFLAK
ncbi:hypothetical protein ROZALSC1DRAFT_25494 [Rozella allomycis CSF55]|uniref:Uncharacterized protein n=1 Tax=Rozella allomycis (strain CSF55) TaxID=988480 RepID=A0A4P9YAV0_ROZAC|nr:hypothetical protein ROZALSC1DRAFT_25494 [Rozella allomycis CSF55]